MEQTQRAETRCAWSALAERLASAGEAFHHQPGTAFRHMSDDRGATVDFGDDAEVDGEGKVNGRAFLEPEIFSFDEYAVRAQVSRATQFTSAAGDRDVDRGACPMPCV